jgi:Flp pilus assembly protein TadG
MIWSWIPRAISQRNDVPQASMESGPEAGPRELVASHSLVRHTWFQAIAGLGKACGGNSIVEFALAVPFLAWMLMGVFKSGMAFNNYLILQGAVNQGV